MLLVQAKAKLQMRNHQRRCMDLLQREWHVKEEKRVAEVQHLKAQLTAQCARVSEVRRVSSSIHQFHGCFMIVL